VVVVLVLVLLPALKFFIDSGRHVFRSVFSLVVTCVSVFLLSNNRVRLNSFARRIEAFQLLCLLPEAFVASDAAAKSRPDEAREAADDS